MSTPVASLQVVSECAECGQWLLERRCPDCAEPITLDDLVDGT
jgi:hypothetical protein